MWMLQPGVCAKAWRDVDQGGLAVDGMLQAPLMMVRENTSVVLSDQYGTLTTLELSCAWQSAATKSFSLNLF
jgi:hypothetical protein